MSRIVDGQYITSVHVTDPNTGADIELEVWKDPESGAIVGIDASFLERIKDEIPSPFNKGTTLRFSEEQLEAEVKRLCTGG